MKVATDIGGTFTDVVILDPSGIHGQKVLSTPRHPDSAVTQVIKTLENISSFSHGTTVATNALLERKGAKVAFVTTKGFRDLLHIARQKRPRLYDFDCARPAPLVRRSLCFEVPERLAPDGTVITPLKDADLTCLVNDIVNAKPDAVAICLLFSYKNPSHEIRVAQALEKQGIPVCRSSDIVPEFREYERASTTTINAFVQPVVSGYIDRIRHALVSNGGPRDYYIMKSAGGVAASREVKPVELLLSGPAGGVSGALLLGKNMDRQNLTTFDMGGTSADFSAIVNNTPLWTDQGQIDGFPVRIPILDMTTIGAGGGSIAWIDKGGALRVGPRSAGSDPGPACYDRGGILPTVTDANLLSGLLDPGSFVHSDLSLSLKKAESAFHTLAQQAGIALEQAVLGVRSVVNANMLRGIRRATVEKGIDARDSTLLAFGGAGPLHAAELAKELGIEEVLIPPMAGMFSALGILLSDVRIDFGETLMARWNKTTQQIADQRLRAFREKAIASIKRQGLEHRKARFCRILDMRYEGQSFHLPVTYNDHDSVSEDFHKAFMKRYGYNLAGDIPLEVVAVRLSTIVKREEIVLPNERASSPCTPARQRQILLSTGFQSAPVYARHKLWQSFAVPGPVIIEDQGCTVFVPPDCMVSLEQNGCLRIEVG